MSEESAELSIEAKTLAEQCNEKHVRVVQAILSGDYTSNTAAYLSVYRESSQDAARSSVAEVLAIPSVKALHLQLREEKLLEGAMTRAEAISILSDMARTKLSDLVDFKNVIVGQDEDGTDVYQATWSIKDQALMNDAQMRSLSELTAGRDGIKIKQHDHKAAMKQLAELSGWEAAKKVHHTGAITHIESEYVEPPIE